MSGRLSMRKDHQHEEDDPVRATRRTLLDGVGAEVVASFPGITRLGGQIVAALYLTEGPLSMDELSAQLGRSKSNIFSNLRALEAAGIVEKRRARGTRHDVFALRGPYPDVIIGAYLAKLRRVIADKQELSRRALRMLGDARGREAEALRTRIGALGRKYDRFSIVFEELMPATDGPVDLESLIGQVPGKLLKAIGALTRRALTRS
ncbi:MAG TPA: MarR family transcriptional regulator [Polyangiaceae bacterium]|nr:MarR family transcriptional regulator [Polyangiaceae bacterium]